MKDVFQIGNPDQWKLERSKSREVEDLQEDFELRLDNDGVREVLAIGNERKKGCPFDCIGCGVHEQADIVSPRRNAELIRKQVEALRARIEANRDLIEEHGYHVAVYNYGNVTNREELSEQNFDSLLEAVDRIDPKPAYLSVNSRGAFVTPELLKFLQAKHLGYDIHFILGVESLTEKGAKLYGKPRIAKEVDSMFATIDAFNEEHGTRFGVDAGFVFLPEFYANDRLDRNAIRRGFVEDVKTLIDMHAGRHTPMRINVHPFYPTAGIAFDETDSYLSDILDGMRELQTYIEGQDYPEHLKPILFIGINDRGYQTPAWQQAIQENQDTLDAINNGLS